MSSTKLITAYANTPQNTIMYEHNKAIGVVIEVDKSTGRVVDAEAMFVTDVAKRFFRNLIVGRDFKGDLEELYQDIERDYLTVSASALIVAIKRAQQRYLESL